MRLAWFRPSECDATAPLVSELAKAHDLELYMPARAHDFVWTHFRSPFDVSVFELSNTATHAFVWPYLLHYGGVLLLQSATLHDSRARALVARGRRDHYAAEFFFNEGHVARPMRPPIHTPQGSWPMLRVPLTAARLTIVPNPALADILRDRFPSARIVYAPLPVRPPDARPTRGADDALTATFGILASDRVEVARRALARARALGANAALVADAPRERILDEADVVLALSWPPPGGNAQQLARDALAAGIPVITLETLATADWPALDPQTWRPRGLSTERPIAVTIDPRDEEHSLAHAIRRLSADAVLRAELGQAGSEWSQAHEGIAMALDRWQRLLEEAAQLDPPCRPADWPAHLTADGTERARSMLHEFGVPIDLF